MQDIAAVPMHGCPRVRLSPRQLLPLLQAWLPEKPQLRQVGAGRVLVKHSVLGDMLLEVDVGPEGDLPTLLFTENDTNHQLLYNGTNATPYVKDAFHNYVVKGWHVRAVRSFGGVMFLLGLFRRVLCVCVCVSE